MAHLGNRSIRSAAVIAGEVEPFGSATLGARVMLSVQDCWINPAEFGDNVSPLAREAGFNFFRIHAG